MKQRLSEWTATGLGIGLAPIAPGTAGSLVAAALWFGWPLNLTGQWIVIAVLSLAGWIASEAIAARGEKDPSRIIIDEMAGMWIALVGLPRELPIVFGAFIIFRALDIIKMTPMKQCERLPGGLGIMADDLAAGILTRVIIGLGLFWIGG